MRQRNKFEIGGLIRMPCNDMVGGYRVWQVTGCFLGALGQEGTYSLLPIDILPNDDEIHVPCWMMETHQAIEVVTYATLADSSAE